MCVSETSDLHFYQGMKGSLETFNCKVLDYVIGVGHFLLVELFEVLTG